MTLREQRGYVSANAQTHKFLLEIRIPVSTIQVFPYLIEKEKEILNFLFFSLHSILMKHLNGSFRRHFYLVAVFG